MKDRIKYLFLYAKSYNSLVISFFLFLLVNGLFICKYTSRLNINSTLIVLMYVCGIFLLFFFPFKKIVGERNKKKNILIFWLTALLIIIGILIAHSLINPFTIQVDRWSAIHNFIDALLRGEYPYLVQTHLGGYGSPFPFWQFLHIPFYLLGDVGLGMLFFFIILVLSLKGILKNYGKAVIYLLLLFLSPAFWYEVLVRSDLLYNFIFCFVIISFIHKNHLVIKQNYYLMGTICGLLLSSRLTIIIPFAIFLLTDFLEANFKEKFKFLLAASSAFTLTFLPFLLKNSSALLFFEYNPFVLQTRQGSFIELIGLTILILYFGLKSSKNISKQMYYTSISIVLFVGFTFLHRMITDNFSESLFSSMYDITYFNMALPFIIYSIVMEFNNKKVNIVFEQVDTLD
jgi:hypothetical protein